MSRLIEIPHFHCLLIFVFFFSNLYWVCEKLRDLGFGFAWRSGFLVALVELFFH